MREPRGAPQALGAGRVFGCSRAGIAAGGAGRGGVTHGVLQSPGGVRACPGRGPGSPRQPHRQRQAVSGHGAAAVTLGRSGSHGRCRSPEQGVSCPEAPLDWWVLVRVGRAGLLLGLLSPCAGESCRRVTSPWERSWPHLERQVIPERTARQSSEWRRQLRSDRGVCRIWRDFSSGRAAHGVLEDPKPLPSFKALLLCQHLVAV